MPTYQIEQYELHSAKYRVKATCEAEAIAKFLEGEGNPVNESLEFIEMAEDRGMPVDDHPSLVRSLRRARHRLQQLHPLDPQHRSGQTPIAANIVQALHYSSLQRSNSVSSGIVYDMQALRSARRSCRPLPGRSRGLRTARRQQLLDLGQQATLPQLVCHRDRIGNGTSCATWWGNLRIAAAVASWGPANATPSRKPILAAGARPCKAAKSLDEFARRRVATAGQDLVFARTDRQRPAHGCWGTLCKVKEHKTESPYAGVNLETFTFDLRQPEDCIALVQAS